jgi:hypothetical protein
MGQPSASVRNATLLVAHLCLKSLPTLSRALVMVVLRGSRCAPAATPIQHLHQHPRCISFSWMRSDALAVMLVSLIPRSWWRSAPKIGGLRANPRRCAARRRGWPWVCSGTPHLILSLDCGGFGRRIAGSLEVEIGALAYGWTQKLCLL